MAKDMIFINWQFRQKNMFYYNCQCKMCDVFSGSNQAIQEYQLKIILRTINVLHNCADSVNIVSC